MVGASLLFIDLDGVSADCLHGHTKQDIMLVHTPVIGLGQDAALHVGQALRCHQQVSSPLPNGNSSGIASSRLTLGAGLNVTLVRWG